MMDIEFYSGIWMLVIVIVVIILIVLFMLAVDKEERIYEEGLKVRAAPQATYLRQLLEEDRDNDWSDYE